MKKLITWTMLKGGLHYKKPSFWIILVSAILCIVVFICFFMLPKETEENSYELSTDDLNNEIRIVSDKKEVLKEYICEQIGFGGIFTLTLYENGTFSYYEGAASSYFGDGDWIFENEKLTLFDRGTGKIRKAIFDYVNGDLIYNQQESDQYSFTYVELEDGKRFIPMDKADEKFHQDLDKQLEEQVEEFRKQVIEAGGNSREDNISLKQFNGLNVEGTLYVDARETVMDEQIPIRIWIENRNGKKLWESELGIPHTAWNSFYLYSQDNINYVIVYYPEESQGQIAYTFKMFTIDENGNEIIKCEYMAESEAEREAFDNNVREYLENANLLVSTIGGEISYKQKGCFANAFVQRKKFIIEFYREGVEKVEERETYISPTELDNFVEYAVDKIIEAVNEEICV